MNVLAVLDDAPYGSERTYDRLRLEGSFTRRDGVRRHVFLTVEAEKVLVF